MKPFASNQQAVLKNQLFHKVLDSLVRQHESDHIYGEVQLLIQKSDVLYQRKLFKASEQLLKRAATKAETFELFETLITIYQRMKRLYIFVLGVGDRAYYIQQFWEMEQKTLAQLANLREMEWLSMQLFDWYYRHHYATTEEEKAAYLARVQHPLLQDIQRAQSFSAKVIYLNTLGLFNDCVGEKKACIDCRAELVDLYQQYPHFIKERATQYLAASNNWLLGLIHLKAYEQAGDALGRILDFPKQIGRPLKGEEEIMWFRMYHSLRLELHIRRGEFEEAIGTIQETSREMKRLGKKLNEVFKLPFYYFFAYAFFALERYDEGLDWLEPLIHKDDLSFRSELFRFARLLHVALHYELGNFDLLSSLCRSTTRYFRKSGKIRPVEKQLLEFWRKAPHENRQAAFTELAHELGVLAKGMEAATELHHFHYIAWLQGHVTGRGFRHCYATAVAD